MLVVMSLLWAAQVHYAWHNVSVMGHWTMPWWHMGVPSSLPEHTLVELLICAFFYLITICIL